MDDRKLTANRLKSYMANYARYYPEIWRQVDNFRAARGKLANWENWCFLPLAAAYAIASQGQDQKELPPIVAQTVGIRTGMIGALYSWRPTQGIYRFHPEVFEAVWSTSLSGELPAELLYRLPEWCVYIETLGKTFGKRPLLGFFVHLEDDANKPGHHELRFVMDLGEDHSLIPMGINLDSGTISCAVESFMEDGLKPNLIGLIEPGQDQHFQNEVRSSLTSEENIDGTVQVVTEIISPLVSLALYLCTINRDLKVAGDGNRQPERPRSVKTRKGVRLFAPERTTEWEVGYRIGAALKLAAQAAEKEERAGGTHASPTPHIRRAHWHSFWSGPMADPERRRLDLKWLPPIPVGVKDLEQDIVPAFHEVH